MAVPPWTWFAGKLPPVDPAALTRLAKAHGLASDQEAVSYLIQRMQQQVIFVNALYQVNLVLTGDWIETSIKRHSRKPMGPERYRHFQRIKNELLGAGVEAVELYPAESRLRDTANQYQMFSHVERGMTFPFGVRQRLVTELEMNGSKQQKFEPVEEPAFADETALQNRAKVQSWFRDPG